MSVYDAKATWLESVWGAVAEAMMNAGLKYDLISDAPVERFGSSDLAMWRRDDDLGLDRYVVVSVVPFDIEGSDDPPCMVEVSVGADDGTRFARHVVARRNCYGIAGVMEFASRGVLETAIEHADALRPDDLDLHRVGGVTESGR